MVIDIHAPSHTKACERHGLRLDFNHQRATLVSAIHISALEWPRNPLDPSHLEKGVRMARRSLFDLSSNAPVPEQRLETPDFFADTRMPFGEHL